MLLSYISATHLSPAYALNPYPVSLKMQIFTIMTVGIMVQHHSSKNAHLPQWCLNSKPCTGMDKHKLTAML